MSQPIGCPNAYSTYHDVDWDLDVGIYSPSEGTPLPANTILAGGDACERWMDELDCESKP